MKMSIRMKKATTLVIAFIMTAAFTACVPVSAAEKRFVVTSNWMYDKNKMDNRRNILGKYNSREDAVAAIRKQPSATKAEWYIYDTKTRTVVYPIKVTTSDRQAKIDKAVAWAVAISKDSRHGYSCGGELSKDNLHLISSRWGRYGDYSCSTLAVMMYDLAGLTEIRKTATYSRCSFVQLRSKQGGGHRYPGISSVNLGSVLLKTKKFKDVSAAYEANGMHALKAGDIMVRGDKGHVAIYVGSGMYTQATSNERNIEYLDNPTPGDSTGREIHTVGFNLPRNYKVYRPIA